MLLPILFIVILIVLVGTITTVLLLQNPRNISSGNSRGQMKAIVSAQRQTGERAGKAKPDLRESLNKSTVQRQSSSKLTTAKKIKYAQWKISPATYHVFELIISLTVCVLLSGKVAIPLQMLSLVLGPVVVNFFVQKSIQRRFNAFDNDYPTFLLSLVGLLKTGMNPMQAIQSAAEGMEHTSILRREIETMMERVRVGVSEEQSIGSFGDDILHPEIELFVQALLLSRRVGGTLSDTLNRLAGQVRKRQYFRKQAVAAVSMQRGSVWFIVAVMTALIIYLLWMFPEIVLQAIRDPNGWLVWQIGFALIITGMYWVTQVSKMKV